MNNVYWTTKCEEIVKGVCALLNSFGGKLCINIENQDLVDFENILDKVIKAIEQRLKHFMQCCSRVHKLRVQVQVQVQHVQVQVQVRS